MWEKRFFVFFFLLWEGKYQRWRWFCFQFLYIVFSFFFERYCLILFVELLFVFVQYQLERGGIIINLENLNQRNAVNVFVFFISIGIFSVLFLFVLGFLVQVLRQFFWVCLCLFLFVFKKARIFFCLVSVVLYFVFIIMFLFFR